MKALIEWIKNFLGLVKVEEVKLEPVVEEEQVAPEKPPLAEKPTGSRKVHSAPKSGSVSQANVKKAVKSVSSKTEPKVTKASLNKLTKAQLEEEGRKVGLELDKRKKKADLVDEVFKQLK